MSNTKKLYRSKIDRVVFGVCGGLGEYFEVDSLILRILFILLTFTGGSGIIIYLILAVIIPDGEEQKKTKGKELINEAQEKTQEIAEELKGSGSWIKNTKNIIGLIIVFIGLNILFERAFDFSPFSFINWGVVWALIIVIIGAKIIFSGKK
jgi:phage shock protein PspC (stress-responsive transcriptional regulator)